MSVDDTMTGAQLLVHMLATKRLSRPFVSVVSAASVAFGWSALLPAVRDSNETANSCWRLVSETYSGQLHSRVFLDVGLEPRNGHCLVCLQTDLHWKPVWLDADTGMLT